MYLTFGELQRLVLRHLFWKMKVAESTRREDDGSVGADVFELAWGAYGCTFEEQPTESQLRSVRRALLQLRDEGHVSRQPHHRYTLTSGAMQAMTEADA
jgi:hypothetical protein